MYVGCCFFFSVLELDNWTLRDAETEIGKDIFNHTFQL